MVAAIFHNIVCNDGGATWWKVVASGILLSCRSENQILSWLLAAQLLVSLYFFFFNICVHLEGKGRKILRALNHYISYVMGVAALIKDASTQNWQTTDSSSTRKVYRAHHCYSRDVVFNSFPTVRCPCIWQAGLFGVGPILYAREQANKPKRCLGHHVSLIRESGKLPFSQRPTSTILLSRRGLIEFPNLFVLHNVLHNVSLEKLLGIQMPAAFKMWTLCTRLHGLALKFRSHFAMPLVQACLGYICRLWDTLHGCAVVAQQDMVTAEGYANDCCITQENVWGSRPLGEF